MVKMSDRRKDLRPREKLQARGAESLSDYELLMAIIGSGNAQADVTKIARDLLKILRRDRTLTMEKVQSVTGVGIAKASRTFQSQPVIYTTYSRATTFAPRERRQLSFILVKGQENVDERELIERITRQTGLAAYSSDEFKDLTLNYFLKNTGIPINVGIAVFLGFIVGAAICGQSFYSFTADNMRYFGTLRAMGATPGMLIKMLLLQALIVGLIGYGLGVGLASCTRYIAANSELAFRLPWQLPLFTAVAVTLVCTIAALLSIRKVLTLEPAIVFRG